MLLAKRQPWRMSPHMISVPRPTPSRPRVRLRPRVMRRSLPALSASGSVNSCRRRFASLFWTTSGSETTSAGQCSTSDGRDGLSALPNKQHDRALHPTANSLRFGGKPACPGFRRRVSLAFDGGGGALREREGSKTLDIKGLRDPQRQFSTRSVGRRSKKSWRHISVPPLYWNGWHPLSQPLRTK